MAANDDVNTHLVTVIHLFLALTLDHRREPCGILAEYYVLKAGLCNEF